MKTKYLVLLSMLFSWFGLLAQDDNIRFKKNAVSITAPAFTRLYSINYERVLRQKKWITTANMGFYHLPLNEGTKVLKALFVGVDFLQGKKTHYLDLGMSLIIDKTANFTYVPGNSLYITASSLIPKIGYRHQKKAKGIFFRALVMPFLVEITPRKPIDQLENNHFIFTTASVDLLSLSIGYSF